MLPCTIKEFAELGVRSAISPALRAPSLVDVSAVRLRSRRSKRGAVCNPQQIELCIAFTTGGAARAPEVSAGGATFTFLNALFTRGLWRVKCAKRTVKEDVRASLAWAGREAYPA
jgi:hypothetical protein